MKLIRCILNDSKWIFLYYNPPLPYHYYNEWMYFPISSGYILHRRFGYRSQINYHLPDNRKRIANIVPWEPAGIYHR